MTVGVARTIRRATLLSRGIEVRVKVDEGARVAVVLSSQGLRKRKRAGDAVPRAITTTLARLTKQHPGAKREVKLRLKLGRTAKAELRRARGPVKVRILVTARDAAGNDRSVVKTVTVGRVV